MKAISRAFILSSMLVPVVASAQEIRLSDQDRTAIAAEVIDYFRKNPGELSLEATDKTKATEAQTPSLDVFAGAADDPWYGAEDAPISILVFSDYGCAACNDVEETLYEIADMRGDVKIVHRDYPTSGEAAVSASLDVISAFNSVPQGDWLKLRSTLMTTGVAPEYRIAALSAAGIEQSGAINPSVKLTMLKNRELARRAGLTALPAVIVMKGDGVVPISGNVTAETLATAIDLLEQK